jgi:hypothetical protein
MAIDIYYIRGYIDLEYTVACEPFGHKCGFSQKYPLPMFETGE